MRARPRVYKQNMDTWVVHVGKVEITFTKMNGLVYIYAT